jgi:hypothetical protein
MKEYKKGDKMLKNILIGSLITISMIGLSGCAEKNEAGGKCDSAKKVETSKCDGAKKVEASKCNTGQ